MAGDLLSHLGKQQQLAAHLEPVCFLSSPQDTFKKTWCKKEGLLTGGCGIINRVIRLQINLDYMNLTRQQPCNATNNFYYLYQGKKNG